MKRFERLDEAEAPDGTVLTLYRHDGAYTIRVRGVELMSTRRHLSEERLAELACAPLAQRAGARVLIGGLGLGYTLRAALAALPADAAVQVAELVEGVIRWNRNPEYPLAADVLDDPRVEIVREDVVAVLQRSHGRFDAVMLDVDNGADALSTAGNARLYRAAGIRLAAAALRPGGTVAYWSADPDPDFAAALGRAGFQVETARVSTYPGSGTWHTLFIARKPAPADAA